MQKLLISLAIAAVGLVGQSQAFAQASYWPAYRLDAPYWPAYRSHDYREGCVRWNWQELSYYNYCAASDRRPLRALKARG